MLFKVGNEIIDTDKVPVGLVFKDKEEGKNVANILANIINGETQHPIDGNGNWWFMVPAGWTLEERDSWSVLTDGEKSLLERSGKVATKPEFEL